MNGDSTFLTFDIPSFPICQFCLCTLPIALIQIYTLYLHLKQMIRLPQSNYDRLLIWATTINTILVRFVLKKKNTKRCMLTALIVLIGYITLSIWRNHIVPIRYPLFLIYLCATTCTIHQCYFINQLLTNQTSRQHQLYTSSLNEQYIELLQMRKQYQRKVLPAEMKYHLYLRRSFCFTVCYIKWLGYFLMWDLTESKDSMGEFFVIVIVQVLPVLVYYFFACANTYLIAQTNEKRNNDLQNG